MVILHPVAFSHKPKSLSYGFLHTTLSSYAKPTVLKDRVSPIAYPLNGVHKPCNDITISFTLTTHADFSTGSDYRTIFKLSKTTTWLRAFSDDARPLITIVPNTNKILFANSPYLIENTLGESINRHTLVNYYNWGIPIAGEVINGDTDFFIEPNRVYQFMLRWEAGQVILFIDDSGFTNEARIDFSYGDYLCENYMDMLAVFGQDSQFSDGGENAEVTVSGFAVDGLCPVQSTETEQFCCNGSSPDDISPEPETADTVLSVNIETSEVWNEEYADPSSQAYADLSLRVENTMMAALNDESYGYVLTEAYVTIGQGEENRRRKRSAHRTDSVVANAQLNFQHPGTVGDLQASVDADLAASDLLSNNDFTAQPSLVTGKQEESCFSSGREFFAGESWTRDCEYHKGVWECADRSCEGPTPVDPCNPCMNGDLLVDYEPAAECSVFSDQVESCYWNGREIFAGESWTQVCECHKGSHTVGRDIPKSEFWPRDKWTCP